MKHQIVKVFPFFAKSNLELEKKLTAAREKRKTI